MKTKSIGLFFAGAFLLAACATAVAKTPPATEMPIETEAVVTLTPEADECLACHIDKQELINTAKPVEVAESESKGVG